MSVFVDFFFWAFFRCVPLTRVPFRSFTDTVVYEWMNKWLAIKSDKEVDQLLQIMVRNSFLVEKGSRKDLHGYKLDNERIDEMSEFKFCVFICTFRVGVFFDSFIVSSPAEYR